MKTLIAAGRVEAGVLVWRIPSSDQRRLPAVLAEMWGGVLVP